MFNEIDNAYLGQQSLFDIINKEDLIFAFFPCVRFTRRMIFNFTRSGAGKTIEHTHNKVERSLINSNYANRFIKEFII